jgi:hypothetical protein
MKNVLTTSKQGNFDLRASDWQLSHKPEIVKTNVDFMEE